MPFLHRAVVALLMLAAVGCSATGTPVPEEMGAADEPTAVAEAPGAEDAAAEPDPTPSLGVSDVVENPGDRMELAFCVNLPCPERGAADAPVTMIEISDFRCEFCGEHLRATQPLIDAEYVDTGKVRLVSHVFASSPPSQFVSAAAMCASEQGKYFEYQAAAFEQQVAFASQELEDMLRVVGEEVGLDAEAFEACLADGRYLTLVSQATADAQALGVLYTPTFIINGRMIEGAEDFEVFQGRIERALAEAGP